jgi:hypothetical protein
MQDQFESIKTGAGGIGELSKIIEVTKREHERLLEAYTRESEAARMKDRDLVEERKRN